ncbi:MAG: hypothetical protein NUW00_03900, partial [Candidatus Kaiserbacteria bacterium]|nr:hypothetical protein [Candidatus Kaiserbacteria bacterium]
MHTLKYFDFFEYPPNLEQLALFSHVVCGVPEVTTCVDELVLKGTAFRWGGRVALRRHVQKVFESKSETFFSQTQELFPIKWFCWIPSIQYIGLSGSRSMVHSDPDADIDLFLITTTNTVWSTRLILLTITRVLSLIGHRTARKLCWNIMIEDSNLQMPIGKRNEYIAHEVLQLKTIFERHHIHDRFMRANSWISKIFPNVQVTYTGKERLYCA